VCSTSVAVTQLRCKPAGVEGSELGRTPFGHAIERSMKANQLSCFVALLLAVACNRPDNDLFGAGSSAPGGGNDNVGGKTSVATAGTASDTAGTGATSVGGSTSNDPTGGSAPVAGGADNRGGTGGSGGANPPDPTTMAGAPDGVAGSGEPPGPDAVCGNGSIESGEECDDAGHTGQDGCDENCKVVCSQHGQGAVESEDHHCYNGYDQATFTGSQQACLQRGAHLASIGSEAENKLARTLVNGSKWIGGYEDVAANMPGNGTYVWLSGEPFTYTNWAKGEPNQLEYHCTPGPYTRCYEHCVSLLGDGTWTDHRCDEPDGYVCEWDPPSAK
jgi:cysteine-rich repeat protein